MSAVRKLPEEPTNKDLATSIEDLHNCLDSLREKSLGDNIILSSQIKMVSEKVDDLKGNQEDLKATQSLIINAFNIKATDKEPSEKESRRTTGKPIALMSQREALTKGAIALGSAGAAAFFAIKMIGTLWPFVWGAAQAIYKSAMR